MDVNFLPASVLMTNQKMLYQAFRTNHSEVHLFFPNLLKISSLCNTLFRAILIFYLVTTFHKENSVLTNHNCEKLSLNKSFDVLLIDHPALSFQISTNQNCHIHSMSRYPDPDLFLLTIFFFPLPSHFFLLILYSFPLFSYNLIQ